MHTQHITEDRGTLYLALPSSKQMVQNIGTAPVGLSAPVAPTPWIHQSPISNATRQLTCDSQNCTHHQISKISFKSLQQSPWRHKSHWLRVLHIPYSFVFGEGSDPQNRVLRMKVRGAETPRKIHKEKKYLLMKAGGETQPDSLRFPTGPGSRHSSAVCVDTDATFLSGELPWVKTYWLGLRFGPQPCQCREASWYWR